MEKKQNGSYKQSCWTCEYCCNKYECIWVRTLKERYKGTKIDDNGYIIECPKYKHDELIYLSGNNLRAYELGISIRKYRFIKNHIKKCKKYKDLNITTVEEYLEYKKNEKAEREQRKIKGYTRMQINYAKRKIKEKNLEISPIEYIEKYILPKHSEEKKDIEYKREYAKKKYREKIEKEFFNNEKDKN